MRRLRSRTPLQDAGGFSFIEVLVALAATVIVMAVLFGLLAQGSGASTAEFDRSELQAQARAALQMISQDVLMAGGNLPPEFPSFRSDLIGIRQMDAQEVEIVGDFDHDAGGTGAFPVISFDGRSAKLGADPVRFRRGDLVLVYDDEPTNGKWMFGLVDEVIRGARPELLLLTSAGAQLEDAIPAIVLPETIETYNRPLPESGFVTPVSVIGYGVETDADAPDLFRSSLWRRVNWGERVNVAYIEDLEIRYFVGGTVAEPVAPTPRDKPADGRGPRILSAPTKKPGAPQHRAEGEWETDSPPVPTPSAKGADGLIQGVRITVTARSRMSNHPGSRLDPEQGAEGSAYIRETLSTRVAPRNLLVQAERRKQQLESAPDKLY